MWNPTPCARRRGDDVRKAEKLSFPRDDFAIPQVGGFYLSRAHGSWGEAKSMLAGQPTPVTGALNLGQKTKALLSKCAGNGVGGVGY